MSSVRVHSCVFGFTQHQRGVVWVLASEVYAQEVKINITLFKSEMFGHSYKSQSTCSKVPVTFETHAIHIRKCIFHMRNMFIHVWCVNPTNAHINRREQKKQVNDRDWKTLVNLQYVFCCSVWSRSTSLFLLAWIASRYETL